MADLDDIPDALPNAPHPRLTRALVGLAPQEEAVLAALRSGRMPHAWLLGGAQGVGKASFAYALARFMLADRHPAERAIAAETLAVEFGSLPVRRILAQAHPDLHVLVRAPQKSGKGFSKFIVVEDARRLLDRVAQSTGEGGWRVCIVDAVDDLNRAAANALLKMLEEPPPATLFLLVSHAPGRLLPTIRSRCRLLRFGPLTEPRIVEAAGAAAAASGSPVEAAAMERAAALADGSVRRALRLADPDTLALASAMLARLDALPGVDLKAILSLAEEVAGKAGETEFALLIETVEGWIAARLRADAAAGPARLAPLAEVWEKLRRAARDVETYNLDRRPLVLTLFHDLSEAVSRSRAA